MYLFTGIIVLAFVFSFWRDNRSLWNPALFLLSLIFIYFSVANLIYQSGYEDLHLLVMVIPFVLLPVSLFLGGIFLIYNGVILLKREGRSKSNYLSLLLGIVILIFLALVSFRMGGRNELFYTNHFLNILFVFIAYSYFIFGFAFAGFMIYSILYLFIPKKKPYDFIIIHGAGLLGGEKVTPLLK